MSSPVKKPRDAKTIARKNREVSRAIIVERISKAAPIVAGVVVLMGFLIFRSADLSHETSRHSGIVETSTWKDNVPIQRVYVTVRLDDGREVQAAGHFNSAPKRGDKVEVSDRVSPFGTESFIVVDAATQG